MFLKQLRKFILGWTLNRYGPWDMGLSRMRMMWYGHVERFIRIIWFVGADGDTSANIALQNIIQEEPKDHDKSTDAHHDAGIFHVSSVGAKQGSGLPTCGSITIHFSNSMFTLI